MKHILQKEEERNRFIGVCQTLLPHFAFRSLQKTIKI